MSEKFNQHYFENYIGKGLHYDEGYKRFSFTNECIKMLQETPAFEDIQTLCVLGVATGKILEDFEKALPNLSLYGCEISRYAHKKIPKRFKENIAKMDLRDYLPTCVENDKKFDLCYTNALMYIPEKHVSKALENCSKISAYLFASIPYEGESFFKDRYRTTLKPKAWWKEKLLSNGFSPTHDPDLWKSDLF
ncbi:MAG: methyltransferase domain-containing protein [Alphaproteobacteria bacterium]